METAEKTGRNQTEKKEIEEKLIKLNRVVKVVKGGRRFKFTALMAVGDRKGKIGIGYGKASEIPEAIRKGMEKAKKNMIKVNLKGETIPHEIKVKYSGAIVWMKPAAKGTGIIAGRAVRAVIELAGIKNILTKSHGSSNAINVVNASFNCLKNLMDINKIAENRGRPKEEIYN